MSLPNGAYGEPHHLEDDAGEQVPAAEQQVPGHPALTDLGNAERFLTTFGEELWWVPELKTWRLWDGRRWREDAGETAALNRAQVTVRFIARHESREVEDPAQMQLLIAHGRKSEHLQRTKALLEQAKARHSLSHERFDQEPLLLNVLNGTLDLTTGELRRHDRRQLLTKLAPVSYDPEAVCPTFEAFLHRVLGGSEPLVRFMVRLMGYFLTGDVGAQILPFFYGEGANGKSTLVTTLQALLGDYAMQAPLEFLLARQHSPHPAEQALLRGARLAVCNEIDQGRCVSEALVKHLTGGDAITAREYYGKHFFTFRPTHKLVLCANHKPVIHGSDEAIWRRIVLIPFGVTIPPEERDPRLAERLRAELPGILSLLVRGALEWRREGLNPPDEVRAASASYRAEQDRIADFIGEVCLEGAGQRVPKPELWQRYLTWAELNRAQTPIRKHEFGRRIAARGHREVKLGRPGVVYWEGIGVRGGNPGGAGSRSADLSAISSKDSPRSSAEEKTRPLVGNVGGQPLENDGNPEGGSP